MKKIVPDPPRPRLIHNHYFVVEPSLLPADALVHASELMSGLIETLEGYCHSRSGEPGLHLLVNASHVAEMARTLIEHATGKFNAAGA